MNEHPHPPQSGRLTPVAPVTPTTPQARHDEVMRGLQRIREEMLALHAQLVCRALLGRLMRRAPRRPV